MYTYIYVYIFLHTFFPFLFLKEPTVARHVTGMLSKRRSNVTVEAFGAVTAVSTAGIFGGAWPGVLDGRENWGSPPKSTSGFQGIFLVPPKNLGKHHIFKWGYISGDYL